MPHEYHAQALREFALMAKRQGDHARAAEIWHALVEDSQDGMQACEQLAIYYEQRLKDNHKALEFARRALSRLHDRDTGLFTHGQFHRRADAAIKRVRRLEKRLAARPRRLLEMATMGESGD